MNIRNLSIKGNVTLKTCADEPIHIPGSIQSYGFLLGVTRDNFKIVYCSENCIKILGFGLKNILGNDLSNFFSAEELSDFIVYYTEKQTDTIRPFSFTINEKSYSAIAHESNGYIVIECEPLYTEIFDLPDLYFQTKRFAYHTERADNVKTLCQDIAAEIRSIIAYDRVMIYRFDEEYNGEVVAESKIDNLQSLLGLHYPHRDIPVQARQLYMLNKIRMLVDVEYKPIPLYALNENNTESEMLDLSYCDLRSFSPIHIRYLKNMGVAASFSISIIHKEKLWGLVACHNHTPRHIPYYTRLAGLLQAVFLSSQLDVRQLADEFEDVKNAEQKIFYLQGILSKEGTNIEDESTLVSIKELLNADGVILVQQEKLFKAGYLPGDELLLPLLKWLQTKQVNGQFNTATLLNKYPAANSLGNFIAGVHFLSLGKKDTYLVWTLREIEKTINWAGNPDKSVIKNEQTSELNPRNSFELWKQAVRFQSRDWTKAEKNSASVICSAIQHVLYIKELKEEEERYQQLNERLQKANDELSNMNWISTHDLKEPLRKIQIYASVILENEAAAIPDSVKQTITRMQTSANKMQVLIDDLLSYTKVINNEERFKEVDLNGVLEEVIAELKENLDEKGGTVEYARLPVVKGIGFQLRQLFVNVLSNAIKFAKDDVPPVIKIDCKTRAEINPNTAENSDATFYHCIMISDNGIGFNKAYKNDIFKIFNRLKTNQYKGSGIGLAICKKIVDACGGFINANSEEGKGSEFLIYFPVIDINQSHNDSGKQL